MSAARRAGLVALFYFFVCSVKLTESCSGSGGVQKDYRKRDLTACDVQTYTGSVFQGETIRVHSGFVFSMERIGNYASKCGVKVHVKSSFQKNNYEHVIGAKVPSATLKNHFVGHAIDMNLIDGDRFCDSVCLSDEVNWTRGISCFIRSIRWDNSLGWGGDFPTKDPDHIDDHINWKDKPTYDTLYASLQKNC